MAQIHSDGTLQTSGTQLDGATQNGNYYYWNGTDVTLNLGDLPPLAVPFITRKSGVASLIDLGGR